VDLREEIARRLEGLGEATPHTDRLGPLARKDECCLRLVRFPPPRRDPAPLVIAPPPPVSRTGFRHHRIRIRFPHGREKRALCPNDASAPGAKIVSYQRAEDSFLRTAGSGIRGGKAGAGRELAA